MFITHNIFAQLTTIFIYLNEVLVKEPYQFNSLNLSGEVSIYDLYYSLTHPSSESSLDLKLARIHITLCLIFIK